MPSNSLESWENPQADFKTKPPNPAVDKTSFGLVKIGKIQRNLQVKLSEAKLRNWIVQRGGITFTDRPACQEKSVVQESLKCQVGEVQMTFMCRQGAYSSVCLPVFLAT